MATNRIVVHVIGDVSSLERAYGRATASTAAFSGTLSSQNRHLLQVSRGALVGSGALAGLTRAVVFASSAFVGAYGLSYALKTSSEAAKEFQGQMELISTQAGATQHEVEKMSKAILNIAPSVGQTPTDLAKGLYHLESAGIRGAAGIKALTAAAKGAAVGQADLESTVNALVGSYKSGITGVGSFTHAVATLSSIVGAGNIRMNDLNQALGTGILPAARAFGLTFQDVGAALATLSIGSVPVVEAATRLRMSFSLLSAGSVKADKALSTVGLTTKQLALDMRHGGIVQAIGDLREHLSHLSPTDQVRLLQKAFGGGRFSTSIITLVQNFDLLKQRLVQIDAGVAKFGSSFEHTQHTAEFASKKFHAATQVLAVEIGATLLPQITKTETAFANWIDKMNKTGRLQRDIKTGAHDVSIGVHLISDAFHIAEGPIVTFTNALGGVGKAIRDLLIVFAVFKAKNAGLFAGMANKAKEAQASMFPQGVAVPAAAARAASAGTGPYVVPDRVSRAGRTVYGPSGPTVLGGAQETRSFEAAYLAGGPARRAMALETLASATMTKGLSSLTAATDLNAASEMKAGVATVDFGDSIKVLTTGLEMTAAEIKAMANEIPWASGNLGFRSTGTLGPGSSERQQLQRDAAAAGFAPYQPSTLTRRGVFGTIRPAFSTGGEDVLLAKKSEEAATGLAKAGQAAKSFGGTLGRSLTSLSSWAMRNSAMAGLGLAFLGPTIAQKAGLGKTVGSTLGGAGFGLLAGGMLPGRLSPVFGTAIGAGIGLHTHGGQLGRTAGDILAGAGAGALVGSAVGAASGPLAPVAVPIGAVVGGLTGAFVSLRHHSESAAAALGRLSKSVPSARAHVQLAQRGLVETRGQLQIDKFARDQAKQSRDQARAAAISTRGTKDHKVAVDALHAAEAQYERSLRQVSDDEKSIVGWQHKLGSSKKEVVTNNKQIAKSFERVTRSIRDIPTLDKTSSVTTMLDTNARTSTNKLKDFEQAMTNLAEKGGPEMKKVANMLILIANLTNKIPNKHEIEIVVRTVFKGPTGKEIRRNLLQETAHHQLPSTPSKAKPEKLKVIPPHDFVLPLSIQLDLARASTQSSKRQIEADKTALAFVRKQIESGKLTKKGLIDAYNEVASLQSDISSLTKKGRKGSKLSEILPPRFTSQMERATAQVSKAEVSGIPAQQINAMEKLEAVYQKALMYLKSEHETGAKRLLQIREEATLTGKIADVRKQIGSLISQAADAARQSLGQLFQGPVLAPTQQQQNAMLGVPSVGPGTLTKDLRAQTKQFARFEHDLQILRRRGASKQLINELQAQGPSALPQVEALAKGSKANLDAFFKAFAAREKLVTRVAKVELHAGIVNLKAAHVNVVGARSSNPTSVRQHGHEPRTRHHHHRHIPHMAEGGIVDKPTLALIGERGREAVIPLPRNFSFPNLGKGHDAVVWMLTKIENTLRHILASLHHGGHGDNSGMEGISMPPIRIGGVPKVNATLLTAYHVERILPHAQESHSGAREFIVNLDGREVGRGLLPHHQRQARAGVAQVRGRHYGHNLALT